MQVICNCVPPDRSSKMIAQPSTKKANWRAGVSIATEQPSFVACSLGGRERSSFSFHTLSLPLFFFFFFNFVLPIQTTARWAALSHTFTKEQERSVARSSLWHIVHVMLAHAAHCAGDAYRHLQSCSLHLHCRNHCHTITPDSLTDYNTQQ